MSPCVLVSLLLTACSFMGTFGLDSPVVTAALTTAPSPQTTELSTETAGGDLQADNDEDYDQEEEEGSFSDTDLPQVQPVTKPEDKGKNKKKGKGKRKAKSKGTPVTSHTPGHTRQPPEHAKAENPCSTTHQEYCIHGHCKYMEDLRAPTCVCIPGYDGERCGIQVLKTGQKESDESSNAEVVQMVLVVIAVVLSLVSCATILLMLCAHYRTHKNFLAAYLGTSSEKEKLQSNTKGIMV